VKNRTNRRRKPVYTGRCGNIKVPVYKRKQQKRGTIYVSYTVSDLSQRKATGKRKLWSFSNFEEAKAKSNEIAQLVAAGEPSLVPLTCIKREIVNALEAIEPAGLQIDYACRLIADACQIIPHSKFLDACRLYKQLEPDKPFTPKLVKDAVKDYFALPKKVGWKRLKTLKGYLNIFERRFGEQMLHMVDIIEFKDFVDSQEWAAKTYNEFLRGISILYREAQFRRWAPATCNPTALIKRLPETAPVIGIFDPSECKQLLDRLSVTASELVATVAIWAFSGIRMEEIGRMDWPQVNRGLETGKFVLEAWQTKKKKQRSVPVMANLKIWLTHFNLREGPVLPVYWLTPTKSSGNRLSELPRYIRRKTKCEWRDNWGRHSFGTYYFKICKDPGEVIKAMGNSVKDFERDYWNKADNVTEATSVEWFNIMPAVPGNVVNMVNAQTSAESYPAKPALTPGVTSEKTRTCSLPS
jgi:hypothetical protein